MVGGVKILDGAMGTELGRRGVSLGERGWSVGAITGAPEVIVEVHRSYAAAGARWHRGNTFRAQPRVTGEYRQLARRACELARAGVALAGVAGPQRFVGSMAPIEDCYRPDLSPPEEEARREHRQIAEALAEAGFDMIVCEAFPHAGEAVIAVEEAAETGLEVWASLTAGPDASLMTPAAMAAAARDCVIAGATAVLVNCTAATKTLPYVEALATAGVEFGAYANAGEESERLGWGAPPEEAAARYAELAAAWARAGATILGGCCGTGPAHVAALAAVARAC